ncbi:hypothetical protein LIP_0341 [Limnochorda pilosa]|uniref:Uncharacterized protein n=1 Tax=Limnochorda pilosa TaxID=1555112 RepID=A0A0K2SGH1_LIMPI|nr:hypothetical protein LIP_0341 [Limnochorda pilosa]
MADQLAALRSYRSKDVDELCMVGEPDPTGLTDHGIEAPGHNQRVAEIIHLVKNGFRRAVPHAPFIECNAHPLQSSFLGWSQPDDHCHQRLEPPISRQLAFP